MVGQMVGQKLAGRYRLLKQLGQGGFGQAYLAEDEHLPDQYQCVVKRFHMGESHQEDTLRTAKRLFDEEAKVLHRLGDHEQLPKLLAHFEDDGEFYLVEEYIPGPSLDQELQPGVPLPESEVRKLLEDLLTVLSFVHDKQVIHRDIKPSNIIRREADRKLVLIDFGAVKQVTTQMIGGTVRPHTVVIGTPGYMPSEQFRGSPKPSSDVYAVGMIGIQAITGANPSLGGLPEDDETGEIQWQDKAEVSAELAQILNKMVRYDFRQRYRNAQDALADLLTLSQDSPQVALESTIIAHGTPPTEVDLPQPLDTTEQQAVQLDEHSTRVQGVPDTPPPLPTEVQHQADPDPTPLEVTPTPLKQPQRADASLKNKSKAKFWIGGGVAIAASSLIAVLGTPHIASICPTLGNCTSSIQAKAEYSNALSYLESTSEKIQAAQSLADLEKIYENMQTALSKMQTLGSNNKFSVAADAQAKADDYVTQVKQLKTRIEQEKAGQTHFNSAIAKASEAFKEKPKAETIAAKEANLKKWQTAIDSLKKIDKATFVFPQAQTKQKDYEAHIKNLNASIEKILAEERAWQQQQAAANRPQPAAPSYQEPAYQAPAPSYNSSYQEPAYQAPAPTYQEPVYQEPVYQEPAYQEPAPAPPPSNSEPLWGGSSDPQSEPLW